MRERPALFSDWLDAGSAIGCDGALRRIESRLVLAFAVEAGPPGNLDQVLIVSCAMHFILGRLQLPGRGLHDAFLLGWDK
jgi:hypothetical protein